MNMTQAHAWWKRHELDKRGSLTADDILAARDADWDEALLEHSRRHTLARRARLLQVAQWMQHHGLARLSPELAAGAVLVDYINAFRENERRDR